MAGPIGYLELEAFRNIISARLDFPAKTTFLCGANGAGKTTILEAIYLLGHGRSFRSTRLDALVRSGGEGFVVRAGCSRPTGEQERIGFEYRAGRVRVHADGQQVRTRGDLARRLPIRLLTPQALQLLEGGPEVRRRFLDWGLFHVKPAFHECWQRYRRLLRQRNMALRQGGIEPRNLATWSEALAAAGESLDRFRRDYLAALMPVYADIQGRLAVTSDFVQIDYRSGWPAGRPLAEALERALKRDQALGTTTAGPHRAELRILAHGQPARQVLSGGQRKMAVIALLLAQVQLLDQQTGRASLFLVDELADTLDAQHLARVLAELQGGSAQLILTAIERTPFEAPLTAPAAWFHVKHGEIHEMV